MLQSTLTRAALCATGGAVAAMTLAGPATAVPGAAPVLPAKSAPAQSAPAKSTAGKFAPGLGGGRVHYGYVKRTTRIHARPSSFSRTIGFLRQGRIVHLECKVRSQFLPGSVTWYKLAKRNGWVNARYIAAFDRVPYCRYWR